LLHTTVFLLGERNGIQVPGLFIGMKILEQTTASLSPRRAGCGTGKGKRVCGSKAKAKGKEKETRRE